MWGHYGPKIVRVVLGPLNETLGSIVDIIWWYRFFFYGGLCPIYFSRVLGSNGSIFVF
jgi:hypothetical protein